jgi:hypothetical protein
LNLITPIMAKTHVSLLFICRILTGATQGKRSHTTAF